MNDLSKKVEEVKIVPNSTKVAENGKSVATLQTQKNIELQEKKKELNKILSPISADGRLKNLEHFQKLAEKYNFLKGKNDDLTSFMIGRDGMRDKIIIMNDTHQVIEISNSEVIEEVLKVCEIKLGTLLNESEQQIINFSI